jgi:hypothetical protein
VTRLALRRVGLALAVLLLLGPAAVTVMRIQRALELDRAAEGFEAAVGSLDPEAYAAAPVADEANAALPVLEAFDRIGGREHPPGWRGEVGRLRQRNRTAAAAWTAEERAWARGLVAGSGGALEALGRASGRPAAAFGLDYSEGLEMEIPALVQAIAAGDLLFAQARLGWLEGRASGTTEAVEAVAALFALSAALEAEAPLIFQLVGHHVEMLQYRAIQDALALGLRDPESLRRLRAATAERPRTELLERAVGFEAAALYLARPGGRYGRAIVSEERWPVRVHYRWLGHRSATRGLGYYQRIAQASSERPFAELVDRQAFRAPRVGPASRLVTNLRDSVGTLKATESLRRLARIALEAAVVAAETGALPEAPPSVPEPGPDPFAGTAPVYEPRSDGGATLTLPGGDELWRGVRPGRARDADEAPLFTWLLAPVSITVEGDGASE